MSRAPRYDFHKIQAYRADDAPWSEIAAAYDVPAATVRGAYSRWLRKQKSVQSSGFESIKAKVGAGLSGGKIDAVDVYESTHPLYTPPGEGDLGGTGKAEAPTVEEGIVPPHSESVVGILTKEQISRITSLEDLITFFKVDTKLWQVRGYRVNKWEQHSVAKGVVELYQVRANLIPRIERQVEIARSIVADFIEDARTHAPTSYGVLSWSKETSPYWRTDDPVLYELAIFDPHLGMLAWGKEVGEPYDLNIAARDYAAAVDHLLAFAQMYPVERVLFIVGNDFLHVDSTAPTQKGMGRGGATSQGTMQEVDSRLAKMFTAARRAAVAAIDKARLIAPVDVLIVPGNHDEQQMYRMGEVLSAWYRNDPEVTVIYGPNKRKFYKYGKNVFMFTHGEEYRRQRDSLPLIFATECPPEMWTGAEHREIHTGHNHIKLEGKYHPTSESNETRAIRTRSLPGLTATDAWHYAEGYKHRRSATALAFRKSGGPAGVHEFNI